jgi:hypothetical protein
VVQLARIGPAPQHAVDDQVVAQLRRAAGRTHAVAHVGQHAARQYDHRVVVRQVGARLAQQHRLVVAWLGLGEAVVEHAVGREVEAAVVGDERRRGGLARAAFTPQLVQDARGVIAQRPTGALEVCPHLFGQHRNAERVAERARERGLADARRARQPDPPARLTRHAAPCCAASRGGTGG